MAQTILSLKKSVEHVFPARTLAQIDYPTTAPASYGEPVDSAIESFGSKV